MDGRNRTKLPGKQGAGRFGWIVLPTWSNLLVFCSIIVRVPQLIQSFHWAVGVWRHVGMHLNVGSVAMQLLPKTKPLSTADRGAEILIISAGGAL